MESHLYEGIQTAEFYDKLENVLATQTNAFKVNIALGLALKKATQVASEAIGSSGDAAVAKRTSKRRSPSPSASDNRPKPRFVEREFNSGREDDAEFESTHDAPVGSVGGHSPVPSEHKDDSVQSLASDQGDHSPRPSVRSESPAVKAKCSSKAGGDEEENSRKRLSLAEGLARAKASKAEGAEPSKKQEEEKEEEEEEEGAIAEPGEVSNDLDQQQEEFQAAQRVCGGSVVAPVSQGAAINSRGYWPPEESFGADLFLELLVAPRGLVGDYTSRGIYERALV
ncbi:hypothetical protein GN244_ATG10625 [Phytophthora infestans]|uniref:Uncharacterized protein n=1 Tax=Phytophthora infestans TaxID=4787 RepID=A0A833S8Z4_PHYIN|nr:hypothetical protein GN244_ATG10625 [Phytophthora infestans]